MKDQMNEGSWTENVWMVGAGMLVVGLIVGFLIGWFWQKNSSQVQVSDNTTEGTNNATTTGNTTSGDVPSLVNTYKTIEASASVSVDDQKAGNLVFIKHTETSKPTWITIREILNGSIGNIIGAGMVTAVTDDVPVTLLRPTKAGEKYAVFLYQDNGNGKFDFKTDLLVLSDSKPVAAMFTAQ